MTRSTDWRAALASIDPVTAQAPVTLHAAQLLMTRGRNVEAEAAILEFLDWHPDHPLALQTLGALLRRMGRWDEAVAPLTRVAQLESAQFAQQPHEQSEVTQFLAAADGCSVAPATAPTAFVTSLFDRAAGDFESRLRGHLAYTGPELLHRAIQQVAGESAHDLDILDLGCGTGLAGVLFRPFARRLDGVDLSPKMLSLAEAKGVYDHLSEAEIVAYLGTPNHRYDLVVAADVLVYFGDLDAIVTAVRRTLSDGGWFAFTCEMAVDTDFVLQPVRRYAHSRDYLLRLAGVHGFTVAYLEEAAVRFEATHPVRSFVCVWAKNPREACGTT
ncbi:MAG: methyltransferase domain-containing protein [Gemmataceae bacterium]